MDPGAGQTSAGAGLVFEFGKNWQDLVRAGIDERRLEGARASVCRLLGVSDLSGRSFLDVGCGSGLSCLAAASLGARRIVGFDPDEDAITAALHLREQFRIDHATWKVLRGSILDGDFLATLEPADVVHAWGSLHHTGAMWQAIDNTARLVAPEGALVVSIYNRVERRIGGSDHWRRIKRFYNRAPHSVRRLMEYGYIAQVMARDLAVRRAPASGMWKAARRGMDLRRNVRDWLGGFPYECATAGAVFEHVHRKLDLELVYLNTVEGHGCNELTFRRRAAR